MDTGQESELVTGYPSNTYPNNASNLILEIPTDKVENPNKQPNANQPTPKYV